MRFVFIGGCGRSGTTLVQKILIAHSKIAGGPEFDFSGEIASLYKKMSSPDQIKRHSFFYNEEKVRTKFRNFYYSFFQDVLADKPGAIIISEKTPININSAHLLLEMFPDAFFINIIRDGRDVYLSHKEVAARYRNKGQHVNKDAFSVFGVARTWNRALYQYERLKNSAVKDRVKNIHYEKLLHEPEAELRRLCSEIDVDFEPGMLDVSFVNKQADPNFLSDGIWYSKENLSQDFDTRKIGRWKNELTEAEKIELSQLMNENLSNFGYEVENYPASRRIVAGIKRKIRGKD